MFILQAVSHFPKPSLARLDPNDPNMIIGIPDEPVISIDTTKDGKKVSTCRDRYMDGWMDGWMDR